ncbi:hypothetical protein RI129_011033 [Pyrocoelia pectoralis]|uniref:Uncharacterized protein n=1 Tax=Pyrocoelia pectoralis TaxID=417401 RepID=A0AAN7ZEZ2_9COLE
MAAVKHLLILGAVFHASLCFNSTRTVKEVFDLWRDKSQNEHPECMISSGATAEEVDEFWLNHNIDNISSSMKCYLACIMKAFKLVSPTGDFDGTEIVKAIDRITSGATEHCKKVPPEVTDECERIYHFIRCGIHYNHELED